MKNRIKSITSVLVLTLLLATSVWGQETAVVFECEDIGVEARRVLANLKEERFRLGEREKMLTEQEKQLKIMEQEVDKKIERLKNIRIDLEQLLAEKDQIENDKVKKLSKIYQKRDPKGAAVSLAAMDKDLAVSILSMMRDKYAGEILDNMDNETAVVYSTALGRLGK